MPTTDLDATKNLQKTLVEINTRKKQLEIINDNLHKLQAKADEMIPNQDLIWAKHLEEFNKKLVTQLEGQQGITLTSEEKNILNDTNYSSIEEKRGDLEKLGIKPLDTAFAINALAAVVAAFSRNLQKIDPKNLLKIIKSLPVIKEEKNVAEEIKSQYQEQYSKLIGEVEALKKQALAIPGLSQAQLENIEQLAKIIHVLPKTAIPITPGEKVGQRLED